MEEKFSFPKEIASAWKKIELEGKTIGAEKVDTPSKRIKKDDAHSGESSEEITVERKITFIPKILTIQRTILKGKKVIEEHVSSVVSIKNAKEKKVSREKPPPPPLPFLIFSFTDKRHFDVVDDDSKLVELMDIAMSSAR
ncbi:hypothetical protein ACFE04_021197 [Oxalis oulophora]